ncbi:MAG: hypothetical protein Ta2B_08080 [Termitinemataceae bacterium]|nr:MAG: hypothetical protein Ta2B_08080 [Termitinemataceae bacterium]
MNVTEQAVQPQYYGVKDIASILGVSRATVSVAIKRGKIPCIRVSNYPLIPREWVEQIHTEATSFMQGATNG